MFLLFHLYIFYRCCNLSFRSFLPFHIALFRVPFWCHIQRFLRHRIFPVWDWMPDLSDIPYVFCCRYDRRNNVHNPHSPALSLLHHIACLERILAAGDSPVWLCHCVHSLLELARHSWNLSGWSMSLASTVCRSASCCCHIGCNSGNQWGGGSSSTCPPRGSLDTRVPALVDKKKLSPISSSRRQPRRAEIPPTWGLQKIKTHLKVNFNFLCWLVACRFCWK